MNERCHVGPQASLHLASAERDALLRENDKIILYYKKVGGRAGVLVGRLVGWF